MSQLQSYITEKKLKPQTILNRSTRLETASEEDLAAARARAEHRAKNQNGNYGEAQLAKPKSGRPLSKRQLATMTEGGTVSKRVRAKLVRALASLAGEGADVEALRKMIAPVPPRKEKTEAAADAE